MQFALTGWMQLKEENPGVSFGELAKLISEQWKSISAEEKVPYENMAKQVRGRVLA